MICQIVTYDMYCSLLIALLSTIWFVKPFLQPEIENTYEFEKKDDVCPISMSRHGMRIGDTYLSSSLLTSPSIHFNTGRSLFGVKHLSLRSETDYFIIDIPESCTTEQFRLSYETWLEKYPY